MFENKKLNQEEQKKDVAQAINFVESLTPAGKQILYNLIGAAEFFEKAGMLKNSSQM